MTNDNINAPARWLLLAVICIWITACSDSTPNPAPQGTSAIPTPFIQEQSSQVIFATMEDRLKHTDIVIIGRPVGEKGIINGARDVSDLTKTDPDMFGILQVYEVEVIRYIKGEGANSLFVVQHQGTVFLNTQELSESAIEAARERENVIPLAINERYVMFLAFSEFAYEGYPTEQLAGGLGHPWLFRINELDCVQAEDVDSAWLLNYFPPQTLEGFIQWVENPALYVGSFPYPAPEVEDQCIIDSLSKPYP
jgi:hypothetical protein